MIELFLKVLGGLVRDLVKFVLVIVALTYLVSGFGLLFAVANLGVILGDSSTPVVVLNLVILTAIVSSWVWFTRDWLKNRVKREEDKLDVNRGDNN